MDTIYSMEPVSMAVYLEMQVKEHVNHHVHLIMLHRPLPTLMLFPNLVWRYVQLHQREVVMVWMLRCIALRNVHLIIIPQMWLEDVSYAWMVAITALPLQHVFLAIQVTSTQRIFAWRLAPILCLTTMVLLALPIASTVLTLWLIWSHVEPAQRSVQHARR